jgi:hypothetical protein
MTFDYTPLLSLQRDLYRIPRGRERFQTYLRELIDWKIEDMKLPLFVMNPGARDHLPTFVDGLLALDADGLGARAVANANVAGPGEFKVALVVADDVAGGWTNRYASEYAHRFESMRINDHGWLIGILWASEPPSDQSITEELLTALFRLAYVRQHGVAHTLRERMAQEGWAMAQAGCTGPTLDADDIEYTREVIAPFLNATDMRTAIECLYGDASGQTLGFTPRGLSPRAGLALARFDSCRDAASGENYGRDIPTKLPSFSRDRAQRNAPTSGLS